MDNDIVRANECVGSNCTDCFENSANDCLNDDNSGSVDTVCTVGSSEVVGSSKDNAVGSSGIVDRISLAQSVLKDIGLLDEVEPDEVVFFSNELGERDFSKIAKTIAYIRKRTIEGVGRVAAFMHAFPERCIVTDVKNVKKWGSNKTVGSELSKKSIEIKAKRLEQTRVYKSILTSLHTSLYTIFALERIEALQYAFSKAMDESVKDKDRVEYLKTFLQETRKPEKSKEFEFNVNIHNNNVSLNQIEDRLGEFAQKLNGLSAGSIIDLIEDKNDSK